MFETLLQVVERLVFGSYKKIGINILYIDQLLTVAPYFDKYIRNDFLSKIAIVYKVDRKMKEPLVIDLK